MRAETDEECRQNLAPDQHALFDRVRRGIKGNAHMTRTEAFLQYCDDHPEELIGEIDRVSEWKLKQALRPMLDFYETPAWAVRAIVPVLPWKDGMRVLDPGCGSGAILRELSRPQSGRGVAQLSFLGIEKDQARYDQAKSTGLNVRQGDFFYHDEKHDLIVGNPPYSHALEFVQHAIMLAPVVCMLLRLPWLASQRRAQWHRENPCHVNVLPRRPSFTADGKTDATEYAWFLWGTSEAGRYSILNVEARS